MPIFVFEELRKVNFKEKRSKSGMLHLHLYIDPLPQNRSIPQKSTKYVTFV